MTDTHLAEVAILVVILVAIGLGLTIHEFKKHVFPSKQPRRKGDVAKRL